jgi:uncharacterized protein YigA (DUF484 family)
MTSQPSGPDSAPDGVPGEGFDPAALEAATPPQLAAPFPTQPTPPDEDTLAAAVESPPTGVTETDASVVEFLKADPGFFERHPALVAELRIPHASGDAISLVEHQLAILRGQLDDQRRRLSHILARAREYEALSARLHGLTLALIAAPDWPALEAVLHDAMCRDLNAQCVALKLFDLPAPEQAGEDQGDPLVAAFNDFLDRRHCLCGPLASDKSALLFGDFGQEVQSAALIPIHAGERCGVLAIGSGDPTRFHPDMATDILDRMGEVVGHRLQAIAHDHA